MGGKYNQEQVFSFLTKHLGKIESIRNHVLKEYYEERAEERERFKNTIDQYAKHIRDYMGTEWDGIKSRNWPLILIGSTVEVQDMDYSEIDKLKIVPPFYEDKKGKLECASCLSPVGNALLFRAIGEEVKVETPLGNCSFMIKSIELPQV